MFLKTMARQKAQIKDDEQGFILILTLVLLLLLTILGMSSTMLTTVELQIAGNDRTHKEAFYEADGGSEVGALLIEENVSCPLGFSSAGSVDNADPADFMMIQGVEIADTQFALDEVLNDIPVSMSPTELTALVAELDGGDFFPAGLPSDTARTIRIPDNPAAPSDGDVHTNLAIFGETQLVAGSAIQMAAGYDGKGKGAASSGSMIAYDVYSQRVGKNNSETILRLEWMHLIGQEGDCYY